MPIINRTSLGSLQQNVGGESLLTKYDRELKRKLDHDRGVDVQQPTPSRKNKNTGIDIPEGFGALDTSEASTSPFLKQQNAFDENGTPVSIKKNAPNLGDSNYVQKYINGGVSKKDAMDLRRVNSEKKLGEINRLELKQNLNKNNFTKDDQQKLNKAYKDYDVYKMMTDPQYFNIRLDQLKDSNAEFEQQLKLVEQPDNYFNMDGFNARFNPQDPADIFGTTDALARLISSDYNKSAMSNYIIKANETQAATSQGKILRTKELDDLGSNVDNFVNSAEQLFDIDYKLSQYQNKPRLTQEEQKQRSELLRQRTEIYRQYSQYKEYCSKFTSWRPYGLEVPYKMFQSLVGLAGSSARDLDELELNIPSSNNFNSIINLVENSNKNETSRGQMRESVRIAKNLMDKFHKTAQSLIKDWQKEYDQDIQDIEDWKKGNNWLGATAQVDNYFKAQEQLAQMNGMNPFSMQTILYATPGLQGASNSSWYKTIASTTAKLVGTAAATIGTGGTSTVIAGLAGATSFAADVSAGADENNAEVKDGVLQRLEGSLNKADLYDQFKNEGFQKLKNTPKMQEFKEKFKASKQLSKNQEVSFDNLQHDEELRKEIEDYIMDEYLAGKWKSSNPKIIKAHADAVIGTNGYYYNDFLSTTRDSFEDALLTCLPIKSAFKTVKGALGSAAKAVGVESSLKTPAAIKGAKDWISKQVARTSLFAKSVPTQIQQRAGQIARGGKGVLEFGARVGEGVRSEMQEEAEQKLNTDSFLNGDFNSQMNTAISARIIDDMCKGMPSTWDYFVPGDMFGHASDEELIANENGAILLALPMSLLTQAPRITAKTKNSISTYNIISQIMRAKKADEMGQIRQNELYAKLASMGDKDSALSLFDKYKKANYDLEQQQKDNDNVRDNDRAVPSEWIDEQRQTFLDMYDYARSGVAQTRAKIRGIKPGTKDYFTFVAQDFYYYQKLKDVRNQLGEAVSTVQNVSESIPGIQDDATGEILSEQLSQNLDARRVYDIAAESQLKEGESVEQKSAELKRRDKDLAGLHATMQIQKEAEAASAATGKKNSASTNLKKTIETLKERIKKDFGIEIENIDDIQKYVTNSDLFDKLNQPSRDVVNLQQSEKMISGQLDELRSNPKKYINKYREAILEDEALEQAIEEDYQATLQEYEDAENREIVDGDIYVGSDGKNYKVVNVNGKPVKYLFDNEKKAVKGTPLPFNRMEYHRAKQAQEKTQQQVQEHVQKAVQDDEKPEEIKPTVVETKKPEVKTPDTKSEPKNKESKSPLNSPKSSNVEVEYHEKPWRNNKDRKNNTARIYLKGKKEKGYFEIVIDRDFNTDKENGEYSVHFKPNGDKKTFTKEEKKELFDALAEMIPEGGIVSTYATKESGITKGGIHGLDRLAKEYGFKKTSSHPYRKNSKGQPVKRTWYVKGSNEKMEGSYYIKGQVKQQIEVEQKQAEPSTPNQQTTVDELNRKTKQDQGHLLKKAGKIVKTGHDYFMKFTNGIVRYTRVHGLDFMDSMYPEKNKEDVKTIREELLQLQQDDLNKYKKRIIELQDEFNKNLSERFGEGSEAYEFHKIDLIPYLHDDLLSDIGIPDAVAQIITRDIPVASVISGTHVDTIARFVFAGMPVENIPEYKMSDETFEKLVKQLKETKRHFEEDLGWVLDTTPHVWHTTLKSGQNVAGETDMISIDKDGKIHILDFKTTKMDLEETEQYKNPDYDPDEEGSEEWIDVTKYSVVPEGAKTRKISKFVLQAPNGAKRSYGQQYIRQLTAYANIIQNSTSFDVVDVLLIPIYVDKTTEDDEAVLKSIDDVQVGDAINLSEVSELQSDVDFVNSQLNKKVDPYTKDDIKKSKKLLEDYVEQLKQWKKNKISEDTKKLIDSLITDINKYDKKLDALLKDKAKMRNAVVVNEYDKEASRIKNRLDVLKQRVKDEDDNAVVETGRRNRLETPDNVYQPMFDEAPEGVKDDEKPEEGDLQNDEDPKDVEDEELTDQDLELESEDAEDSEDTDDEKKYKWFEYNNLAGTVGIKVKSMLDRISRLFRRSGGKDPISVYPDFIKKAKFVVRKEGKYFKVDVIYGDRKFEGLLLNVGHKENSTRRSKLGSALIKQYESLKKQLKKGQRIVATSVSRTNGVIHIGKNHAFVDSMFMSGEEILDQLIAGENSLLGISDGVRVYALQQDSNKGVKPTIYAHIGDANDKDITSGTIVFIYKFKYDEDGVDAKERVIPIVLRPKNLTKNDAKTVIDILKQGPDALDGDFNATVTNSKGTKKSKISGLSNRKVLNMLCRFGGQAAKADNNFIFDFEKNEYGTVVKGGKSIIVSDLRKEKRRGKYPLATIDLTNDKDVQKLEDILQRVQLHCNQEGNLRHNLNAHADTYAENPYASLTKYFENESHEMDIDSSIKLSDSIVIDGHDVYSNDEKDRGLSGAAWMIKHKMLETNVEGIEEPLISINELGIEGQESVQKQVQKKEKEEETKPKVAEAEEVLTSEPEPKPKQEKNPKEDKRQSRNNRFKAAFEALGGGGVVPGARRHKIVKKAGTTPVNRERVMQHLRSIFGKYIPDVQWLDEVIEQTANGCVVGRMMPDIIQLYDAMEPGTEFHEAFHRVLDILLPVKLLEKLQQRFKERHNKSWKEEHGRDMTESDISEEMADQFMEFKLNNQIVTDKGLMRAFGSVMSYIKALHNLKDWQLASLYVAVNTGLFKYIKPKSKSIERFKNVTKGYRNLTIRNQNTGELVEFDQFADYDGRKMYDAAVEGLLYALIVGQNINDTATNVSNLDTSIEAIMKLDFTNRKKVEGETMTPWFRVVTGSYIYDKYEFTEEDAVLFEMMYRNTPVMDYVYDSITDEDLGENPTDEDLRYAVYSKIMELESAKKSIDELQANQRMMHEMMKHPDILHQQLKKKLAKYQVQAKKVINNDQNEGADPEAWDGDDIAVHDYAEFYKHSRAETAGAQVIFFLSTIPDIRFATEEDVENGTVSSTVHEKSGDRVTVQNGTNVLGYKQFASFKTITNRLLQKCHDCKTPEELDARLNELGKTDAIFWTIAKRFHRHLENSIQRHSDENKTPKAYIETISKDGKSVDIRMLDISEYTIKTDEFGKYYVADSKTGQSIQNAKILINHTEESLVTQIWQFVRCQRMDFTFLNIKAALDPKTGEEVDGKYDMRMTSTDSDWASTIYPREWFNRFRNPLFGIFKARIAKEGDKSSKRLIFANKGKLRVISAVDNIDAIRVAIAKGAPNVILTIENNEGEFVEKRYAVNNDFISIENAFVEALNTLGISVDKDTFEECICEFFGTNDVFDAMRSLMSSTNKEISIKAFVKDLQHLSSKLQKGDFSVIETNKAASKNKTRNSNEYSNASGVNLFSDSGFVKTLAHAHSRHIRMTKELMTLGPNHTKRYTMAQCHTASDITDMLKNADVQEAEIIGSSLAKDMAQYAYNLFTLTNRITNKAYPIGSRLLKGILSGENKNLKLHTHGGVKTERSKSGGKDYKQISAREDYLAKMEILRQGGIIFPTLSDKATWFYITGCTLAGYDYNKISTISDSQIPDVVKRDGKFRVEYGDYSENIEILDQMLEYARCEHEMIRMELKRKKHLSPTQKIKNFFTGGNNAVRYASMTEFYTFDENNDYKAEMHLLTDYGKTPEECFEDAEQNFWGSHISNEQRRRSMALVLQRITEQNLQQLQEYGLIEKDDSKSPLKGYSNVGLNNAVIEELKKRIRLRNKTIGKKYKNKDLEEAAVENEAIIAYVNDICAKSIQSCEETERLFTGMPQFFKWKHGKVKDQFTGKTYDCLYDRYDDEVKRHGGLGSTGDQNRTDLPNQNTKYRAAECNDPKVKSEVFNGYVEGFTDNEFRESYFEMIAQELESQEEMEQLADRIFGDVSGKTTDEDGKKVDRMSVEEIKSEIRKKFDKVVGQDEEGNPVTEGDRMIEQIQTKVDSEIRSYTDKQIAVADGAAYVSPKMAKGLLRQRGCLTEKVELAFSILDGTYEEKQKKLGLFKDYVGSKISSKKPLSNSAAYHIITEALLGAQKYSAYGYRMAPASVQDIQEGLGQIPVHYYDKYALFPLFPQIATGFSRDLLQQMEEQEIDMLMMDDAVKVGGCDAKDFPSSDDVDTETGEITKTAQEKLQEFKANGGFTVYEQEYCFLRRQMNTDPHENEERSIGTQMLKVALNGVNKVLMYAERGGKSSIRGWELLSRINKNLNNLSDLGEQYFRHRFWKDGEFDVDEFSNFLEEQLDSRNADANLLDGIQVVIDPVTGKKRLKVPVEAMSSSGWIESILNSAINKEVVDVISDGNAYYQRSIYGAEGQPVGAQLDDGRTLYNGQTLKAINDDGSMDAVISIDYFIHLVPKHLRNNFEAARNFLIENKIIGPEAEANTIGYRIPTQSQSSIHPLRFVDVLPVVRDTIILPKDFTAITGSDFDIDKLYLASIHYEPVYEEETYTDKEGKPKTRKKQVGVTADLPKPDDLSTFSNEDFGRGSKKYKNARKYYQNALLFDYLTALKDRGKIVDGKYIPGNGFHYAYRSVDKDTSLIDDFLDKLEGEKPKLRWLAYMAGSLAYQVAKKAEFMVGKVGIGPFALNNNSQILTQTYGVRFKQTNLVNTKDRGQIEVPTILECLKASSLCNKQSKRGNRITAWLSGLINIHVDVAKDPKPKKLNINAFTYNLTALLTRIGLDDGALQFVAQPIMKELASINERESGELTFMDPGKSSSQNAKDAMNQFIEDSFLNGTEKENLDTKDLIKNRSNTYDSESEHIVGRVIQQLFGINDNGDYTNTYTIERAGGEEELMSGNILEDILTNKEARIDGEKEVSFANLSDDGSYVYHIVIDGKDVTLTPKQAQLWVYFGYKHFDKYAQAMSNIVNTTKIDTKKQGKNFIEQQSYMDQFKEILSEDSLFEPDGLHAMYGYVYHEPDDDHDEGYFEKYEPSKDSKTHDYEIESFIGRKTFNAMNLYRDLVAEFSLQAQPSYINAHRRLLNMINGSIRNIDLCRKVSGAMMQYLKSVHIFEWMRKEDIEPKKLLLGETSVQDKLIAIQNIIKKDKEGKYYKYGGNGAIYNKLLAALSPDIYEEKEGEENCRFIKLDDSFLDEQDDANDIEQAWDEMLHDDETEFEIGDKVITAKRFAEELIAYAFVTSADTNGMTKFFKYVPNSWRISSGYADYMYNLQTRGVSFTDDELEEIIRNNWQDSDFVKELSLGKNKAQILRNPRFVGSKIDKTKPNLPWIIACVQSYKDKVTKQNVFRSTVSKLRTTDEFPTFIRRRRPDAKDYSSDSYLLYKLIYVGQKYIGKDKEGNDMFVDYPIYALTYPKGKQYKAGSYTYDIKQYTDNSVYSQAYASRYNTPGNTLTQDAISTLSDYVENMKADDVDLSELVENTDEVFEKKQSLRSALYVLKDQELITDKIFSAINKAISKLAKQEKAEKAEKIKSESKPNAEEKSLQNRWNIINKEASMYFSYNGNQRSDVDSETTFEAIINGERTATTRYESEHASFWEDLKEGDVIPIRDTKLSDDPNKNIIWIRITKAATKLSKNVDPESWSKKEGWSVEYFNKKVKSRIGEAYQIEFEYVSSGEEIPSQQDVIEEYTPLFDDAPEGVTDNGFEDSDEYPNDAMNTCKGKK